MVHQVVERARTVGFRMQSYIYGDSTTMPDKVYANSNYWVDVTMTNGPAAKVAFATTALSLAPQARMAPSLLQTASVDTTETADLSPVSKVAMSLTAAVENTRSTFCPRRASI